MLTMTGENRDEHAAGMSVTRTSTNKLLETWRDRERREREVVFVINKLAAAKVTTARTDHVTRGSRDLYKMSDNA